jgi:two-component sensor histidine kinase
VRSIRVYLFALVVICMVVAATAYAVVMTHVASINRQNIEAQSRDTAKALSVAVDGRLERALGVVAALASSDAAVRRDWRTLDRQARAAMLGRDGWIVVQDRSGRQLVNTRLPAGAALPYGKPPAEMWREIAGGKPRVCNLGSGAVEPKIVCVDAPIGSIRNPDYAISIVFAPKAFSTTVTRQGAQNGNIATLVDRAGKVIWRNLKPDQFVGKNATGPMLAALRSGSKSGVLESTSLEGIQMLTAYNRSALSGWTVIVGSPLEELGAGTRQAVLRGTLIFLIVLILGAALAAVLGAKLHSAVMALVGAASPGGSCQSIKPSGITEIDTVSDALRRSFAAKEQSERHQQLLIGELNHRVKNTLSVVQSLAHQTFRGRHSPKDAISAFEARLQALAAAHNLLTSQRWESASMAQVVSSALAPFCTPDRCAFSGPELKVAPQTAVTLALAVHELATNASKYGALRVEGGKIHVSWTAGEEEFELLWQEAGGPPVRTPESDGFGMRLIRRSLAADLRGTVDVEFRESGLQCRVIGRLA